MCLSLKFTQTCLWISALVVLALGVVGIVCAVYVGKDTIMVSSVQDTKKTIMALVIVFSVLLILIAISGIIGVWKGSGWCLFLYNIGIGIFFVAFLVITILAFGAFKKYINVDFKNTAVCQQQDWLSGLDDFSSNAEYYLCSKDCPCDAHNAPFESRVNITVNTSNVTTNEANTTNDNNANATNDDVANNNVTWSHYSNKTNRTYYYNSNGDVRVQDCPNYSKEFSLTQREYGVSLELLEKQFKCAGVCSNSQYYTFSDINSGNPNNNCASTLVDILTSYSKKIGAATIIMTILLFLILINTCCFCCNPEKGKSEGGLYYKMSHVGINEDQKKREQYN